VNSSKLTILSGGAAQGLVDALAAASKARSGCEIDGTFGAVGAMRDKLLGGAPADLVILTRALIDELGAQGHVVMGSVTNIGTVLTAVAVRSGEALPDVGDAAGLRAALLAADAIHFPDPKLATAGIHFARVIERLGIAADVASRIKTYPNGATAMRELAAARGGQPIGCTQVTEILNTPGAQLVAPLPEGFELATVYTAGVCARTILPEQAQAFAVLLTDDTALAARQRAGFI
jgi:molybdate transport system substrate-binding protein